MLTLRQCWCHSLFNKPRALPLRNTSRLPTRSPEAGLVLMTVRSARQIQTARSVRQIQTARSIRRAAAGVLEEPTPNPRAMRFTPTIDPGASVRASPTVEVTRRGVSNSGAAAPQLAWASRLFKSDDNVESVFFGKGFLTVMLSAESCPDESWERVRGEVTHWFAQVSDTDPHSSNSPENTRSGSPLQREIVELLDEKVRPNLQADGGDLEFRGFDQSTGVVKLRLLGACRSCPSSTATLRFGIANLLVYSFPDEVKQVEQVFDEEDEWTADWTG